MSSVSDYSLANQGFSAFRTELNNILGAINTHNLATSAPSSLAAGIMWVDSSSAGTHTVKYYDGSDSITLFNINTSANTVDFIDSSVTTELSGDSTPQLGGNLDLNGNEISGSGKIEVTATDANDFFLLKSGSLDSLKVNGQGVLTLGGFTFTPTAVRGGFYYNNDDDEFYLGKNNYHHDLTYDSLLPLFLNYF